MRHTLKAVFDQRSDAQHVLDELLAAGYSRADAAISDETDASASFTSTLARLFARQHARHVLTLTADSDPDAERAIGIIERFGPAGIEDSPDSGTRSAWTAAVPRPAYRPGTAPGSLQHRSRDDSRYFGIQNIDSPPIGNTFEESMGSTVRWDVDQEDRYPVRLEAYGGTAPDIDNDAYYRTHWNARYANQPEERYDEHLPAYMYGNEARRSEEYRNHHWDQAEAALKAGWEARHGSRLSPWERFKDAVKHGWNRIDFDADAGADGKPH